MVDQIGIKPTTSSLPNDALYQLSYWPLREGRYWEIAGRK